MLRTDIFYTNYLLAVTVICAIVIIEKMGRIEASDDEERLMMDVFRGYNSMIQPVKNGSDR